MSTTPMPASAQQDSQASAKEVSSSNSIMRAAIFWPIWKELHIRAKTSAAHSFAAGGTPTTTPPGNKGSAAVIFATAHIVLR